MEQCVDISFAHELQALIITTIILHWSYVEEMNNPPETPPPPPCILGLFCSDLVCDGPLRVLPRIALCPLCYWGSQSQGAAVLCCGGVTHSYCPDHRQRACKTSLSLISALYLEILSLTLAVGSRSCPGDVYPGSGHFGRDNGCFLGRKLENQKETDTDRAPELEFSLRGAFIGVLWFPLTVQIIPVGGQVNCPQV